MRESTIEEIPFSEQSKLEIYKKLCEGVPDAFFLLSGSVVAKRGHEGAFKSTSYSDVDEHGGIAAGKARVLAMVELSQYFPTVSIVTSSKTHDYLPSHAKIYAEELLQKGVPEVLIEQQDHSYSSFTELIELIKLMKRKNFQHVVCITSEIQIGRVEAMLRHMETLQDPDNRSKEPEFVEALHDFRQKQGKITFVTAEAVLPLRDPRFAKILEQVRKTPSWIKKMELEQKAVDQINQGLYWKKPPDTLIRKPI